MTKNLLVKDSSLQEVFDRCLSHLRSMEYQCTTVSGICAYRNSYGNSCAVGACFPDELYKEEMDKNGGTPVKTLIKNYFPEAKHLIKLLAELQDVHDNTDFWHPEEEGFLEEEASHTLKRICNTFGLEYKRRER